MLKILHVIYSLELGGGPTHIKKLVRDIPALHFVAGGAGSMETDFKTILTDKRTFRLSGSFLVRIMQLEAVEKQINPDIIHVHGRGASILLRLSRINRKAERLIYTIHGFHADHMPPLKRAIYKLIERFLYSRTFAFVHVSTVELVEFTGFLGTFDRSRHHYIPNYIDNEKIYQSPFSGPSLPEMRFLYVGRISEEKGTDILMDAVTLLPDSAETTFHLIGDGASRTTYERKITQAGRQAQVHFLGSVPNASELMKNYHAIIIPSRKEGMPYVLLEAMASNIPIIATPENAIRTVLPESYKYIAKSFSPKDLADCIKEFISDYYSSRDKILKGLEENRKILEQNFSRKVTVATLMNLYGSATLTFDKLND